MLPTLILLLWTYDAETHPNPPLLGFTVNPIDCGVPYNPGPIYRNPQHINDPEARSFELDIADVLRQYEPCNEKAGVVVEVYPFDNTVGDGPPFYTKWVNLWGADLNHNGAVDALDWLQFAGCFPAGDPGAPGCISGDLDNNGSIGAADFLLFAAWYSGNGPY